MTVEGLSGAEPEIALERPFLLTLDNGLGGGVVDAELFADLE